MAQRLLKVTRDNVAFVGVLPPVVPVNAIVTRAGALITTRAGAYVVKRG